MIFATVGTQLPFPRMMAALDAAAPALDEEIVAQTGPDETGWPALTCHEFLNPKEFDALFQQARVVCAHAGIGTILSARRWRKPLVILPRREALGEHRNDHQMATARQVENLPGIYVAWEAEALSGLLSRSDLAPSEDSVGPLQEQLIARIREFIEAPKA